MSVWGLCAVRYLFFLVVFVAGYCVRADASDYGTTGLIDIPTARFESDGMFSAAVSMDGRHKQFSVTYQATPWLQGTFRYTGFEDYFLWDRNYELKARLWEEQRGLPQVAVGLRDIVGTGEFSSEYLVASKKLGRTDVTIGFGWGRLAGDSSLSNPLTQISDRFNTRSSVTGQGGDFSFGDFFSGPNVGIFYGLSHSFESAPITALLEYNPDRYDSSFRRGVARPTSGLSVGFTWKGLPGLDLNFSIQNGDELGVGFRSYLDTKGELSRREPEVFVSSFYMSQRDLPPQINKKSWYDRLLFDIERSGLLLLEAKLSPDNRQAMLVVGNSSYALWSDAIARHTALADLHLPSSVNTIHFVVEEEGYRSATIVVPRPSAYTFTDNRSSLRQMSILSGRTISKPQHLTSFYTGRINTSVNIRSRFQLFDPDDPARYQIFADVSSEFAINNYLTVRASYAIDIENNFGESQRQESNSVLPKVRSNVARYLASGDTGLEKLIVEGRGTRGRSIHYRSVVGLMEAMFGGVGGEVLYWPHKSRIAVGMSLAYVRQRDYDRSLNFLDYHTVTGHISGYWATPFYNYDLAIHAGRYLAKDRGLTVEVRRTFRNGWQVGLWASLTDVPFEEFGEGSFDKGLFFQVPLDGIFSSRTRARFSTRLRPIQRDGGQRLEGYSGDIFWDLRAARYDSFSPPDQRLLP